MSKKTNTWLFILGATVANILITFLCFIALFALYVRFLYPSLPEEAAGWALPVLFIGSIALSFVIYRIVLKQLMKRIDFEKYFDPIFGPRRPQKRRTD